MTESARRATPSRAKPKTKGASGPGKPRKAVTTRTESRAASKAGPGPRAKPAAAAAPATGDRRSRHIGERTRLLGDWRDEILAEVRRLIHEAEPDIVEERKWKKPSNPLGVPVWSHPTHGIVCTGESYKAVVKLTFARGASLKDPHKLFNASLEGNTRRAIDIREGGTLDAAAFMALIRGAVAANTSGSKKSRKPVARAVAKPSTSGGGGTPVKLLSGGNPQIAKADGDAPVQAYIAAMSGGGEGWKRDLGRRLDAIIVRTVPSVRKAVKWNSPFYGVDAQGGAGGGWFLSFHVFARYVKVTFFNGRSLRPVPPGGTEKSKDSRWIDIYEGDALDEAPFASWVRQAAALPGWVP